MKAPPKFKVGDRVIRVKYSEGHSKEAKEVLETTTFTSQPTTDALKFEGDITKYAAECYEFEYIVNSPLNEELK